MDDDDRAARPRHDLHRGGAHEQSTEAPESPGTEDEHVGSRRCGQHGLDRRIGIPKCAHDELGSVLTHVGSRRSSNCSSCSASTTSPSTSGRANTIVNGAW
jgi:hypothetical protein